MKTALRLLSAFFLAFLSATSRAQELRITIGIPDQSSHKGPHALMMALPHTGTNDYLYVDIQNVSKRTLSILDDGNSFGEGTLSFELEAGSKVWYAKKSPAAYTKSALGLIRLKPGETTVRKVFYDSDRNGNWRGFPDGSTTRKVTLIAILKEESKGFKIKDLWSGAVYSMPVTVTFTHK